jgi:hypothetical protein
MFSSRPDSFDTANELDVIASEAKQSPSDRGYIDGIASSLRSSQ